MFILPQRFQLVYGTSGLDAGVRLIPFSAVIPIGSIFASILAGKFKIPPVYLLILGSVLQVLGFALIGTLPSTLDIPSRIYGYQVLAGWGCGINFSLLFILLPFVNEKQDNGRYLLMLYFSRSLPLMKNSYQPLHSAPGPNSDLWVVQSYLLSRLPSLTAMCSHILHPNWVSPMRIL